MHAVIVINKNHIHLGRNWNIYTSVQNVDFTNMSNAKNNLRKRKQMIHIETMGQRESYFSKEQYQAVGEEFSLDDRSFDEIIHEDHEDSEDDENDSTKLIRNTIDSANGTKAQNGTCSIEFSEHEDNESFCSITIEIMFPFIVAGLGMVGAGLVLDIVQHWVVFEQINELFILVPALLGLKGNLEMTLASRLSTQVSFCM